MIAKCKKCGQYPDAWNSENTGLPIGWQHESCYPSRGFLSEGTWNAANAPDAAELAAERNVLNDPNIQELIAESSKPIRSHTGVFNVSIDKALGEDRTETAVYNVDSDEMRDYQKLVRSQCAKVQDIPITDKQKDLLHFSIGMAGETGEVAEIVKKHWIYQRELDVQKCIEECGDALFYLTGFLDTLGFTIKDAINNNSNKIKSRYPSGFNTSDANARRDEKEHESGKV